MGAISLSGLVVSEVGLFGSPTASVINAPPGTTITTDSDQSGNFVGTINVGELMRTDGPCVLSLSFKSRANTRCHIAASVTSYSATNLAFNGKPLTSGLATDLSFIGIGCGTVTAGSNGDSSGHCYGPKFDSGTETLADLNNARIGPVCEGSDSFASFSKKPSRAANLGCSNNYVEDTATFTIPTGLLWEPINGAASGNFSISIQFELLPGA
jgi:hypothetical protein